MEYPYIDLIPAIIKSHIPSVYEGESLTSLEYISKVSAKMNEVVDEFNSFVKSVCDEVDTYKNCTDKDIDLFKRTIEQKFADFISVITLKYQSQDVAIQGAVAEIIASLPEKLQTAIDEMYGNGEFDTLVYNSIENLKNDFDRIVNNINTFQSNINSSFSNTLNDIEAFKSQVKTDFETLEAEFDKKFDDMQTESQVADMQKAIYDTNNNGIVDNAEKLNGQPPSYYAKQQDLDTTNTNIDTLSNSVSSINSQVKTVQNTANTAKTMAEEAKGKADSVTIKVDNAISLANTAQNTANTAKASADSKGINIYLHNVGGLVGEGENGKFKCTIGGTYTSILVNNVEYTVNSGGENSVELVTDAWYTFILDGATINFKSGGGLSNSKLALATAKEEDVTSGKTFYSGDKELKTGSYINNYGTFTSNGTVGEKTSVNVGFKPNIVICWCSSANRNSYWLELRYINGVKSYTLTNGSSYLAQLDGNRYLDISITDTGFELTCTEGWSTLFNYIACK